jgi:hypothetical protein
VPNIGLIHPKPGLEFLNAVDVAFGMLMKCTSCLSATTTPVSRQHLDYLCLCAGADLGKGLLDLEASLHAVSHGLLQSHPLHRMQSRPPQSTAHGHGITYLLPHLHDLEALKVVQSPPLLHSRTLLGPCALIELLLDLVLLPLLCDVTDTAGTGQLGDDNGCEGQFGERDFLARDGGLV